MRLLVLVLVISAAITGCNRQKTPDLKQVVAEVNEKCPQMLDAETRIDRVDYLPPDTVRYVYTLVNLDGSRMDTAYFRSALWPGLLAHIRVSSGMKPLKDQRTVFQYDYCDKHGVRVHRFTIPPALYTDSEKGKTSTP